MSLRDRARHAVDWRMRALVERLDALLGSSERLEARLAGIEQRAAMTDARAQAAVERLEQLGRLLEDRLEPAVRAVVAEESENRRRVHALRASGDYMAPYDDPDPLVSITIPTRERPDLLVDRALASLLAQTHRNLEILVVGDAASSEVEAAVAAVGDPRVRFRNLTQRTLAHPDERRHWPVGSTMARNAAAQLAGGRWLLHFDDDDALHPDAIATLLAHAREARTEVVYGGFTQHSPDGSREDRLAFPPALGTFGWQGAIIHAGLRFFERELVAAHLGMFGDQYLLERMLRAGVSFSMVDRVVWDYFPSTLWE